MNNVIDFIKKQTNKCVYCGLCSTVCPTYQLTRSETESPRGRVIAIQQYTLGHINNSTALQKNITSCLQCGQCTTICPANIPVATLVSHIKSQAPQQKSRWSLWATKHSHRLNVFFPLIKPFIPLASSQSLQLNQIKPPAQDKKSTLALFTGCTGSSFDKDTFLACQSILNKLEQPFVVPKQQQCCGTLHQHSGDFEGYNKLQQKNQELIQKNTFNHYLYFLSGCSSGIDALAEKSSIKSSEVLSYLAQQDWSQIKFAPLKTTVLIHLPCSAKPKSKNDIEYLLSKIPQLSWRFIEDAGSCCGSAGTHMLTHKKRAAELRQPFLDKISQHAVKHNLVLSTNIGCRLHLAAGIKENNVKIAHPVFLLNQQIL